MDILKMSDRKLKDLVNEDDYIEDFNESQAKKLMKQAFTELRELLKNNEAAEDGK